MFLLNIERKIHIVNMTQTKLKSLEEGVQDENKLETNKPGFICRLAAAYFSPKPFEKNGKIYEYLGIKQFKKALMGSAGKLLRAKKPDAFNYFIGQKISTERLEIFAAATLLNESVHVMGQVGLGGLLLIDFAYGNYGLAAASGIVSIPNLYLIALQRYNRERILNVLDHRTNRIS
jgi:hypothetical protein